MRALAVLISLALAGCMTERMPPVAEYPAVPKQSTFLVKKIEYDGHGRPVYGEILDRRPGSAGERFTVVHAVDNRPSRSYDIVIVEQPKAGRGPLAVVYEWTGRGFEGGVAVSSGFYPQGAIDSGKDAIIYLAIKAAPIVIFTATGFVVGVVASIPETANELKRVIVNTREKVVSRTEYAYDTQGRIRFMKLFAPTGPADELVKTEFFYAGNSEVPARAEVTSAPEKKVRTIP